MSNRFLIPAWTAKSIVFVFIIVTVFSLPSGVSAGVKIRVLFISYSNPYGRDAAGADCDLWNNACDPKFSITISTPDGRSNSWTTDRASDQNDVYFGNKVVDIVNPLEIQRDKYDGRFTIHVKVDDFDPIGAWDYMGTFVYTFLGTAGLNGDFRNVKAVRLNPDGLSGATLTLELSVACLENFYSTDCTKYCVAGNDDSSGHYTCSPAGGKLCLPTYDPVSSCRQTYCASRTPCKNNGTCANLDSGFACECVGLWGGPTCETKLSACDSPDTPCRNNGTCIPGTGAGGCSCTPGFNGTFCESDIDECAASPPVCQHASACLNQFGTYSCHCLAGWTGKNCTEDVDECKLTNACFNGGTCVNSPPGNFTCQCAKGFSGPRCEQDIDECSASTDGPCKTDGSQVCRNLHGSFTCLCTMGWSGVNCTSRYQTEAELSAANNNRLLVGLLVPALLLAIAAVVVFFAYRLIRSRRHQAAEGRSVDHLTQSTRTGHSSAISIDNASYAYSVAGLHSGSGADCPYEDAEAQYAKVQSLPRNGSEDTYNNVVCRESPPVFRAPPLPPKRLVEHRAAATSNDADNERQAGGGYEEMTPELQESEL
ncbi:hypothetical protein BOX15_Mlig026650g1 [Macrostomum lignano]|uniref:EGF-like domain-containing protein n=1 Tax=Macrostomum lignano TaxID=282301 RepID=A0A267H262_9PLAT|nr:hypothetical protein BOX15_Mlig026650g1 [Macrostomum lignano]